MTTSSPPVAASSISRDVSSGSTADDLSWTKGELFEQQDGPNGSGTNKQIQVWTLSQ
jgi:hypothetical protein